MVVMVVFSQFLLGQPHCFEAVFEVLALPPWTESAWGWMGMDGFVVVLSPDLWKWKKNISERAIFLNGDCVVSLLVMQDLLDYPKESSCGYWVLLNQRAEDNGESQFCILLPKDRWLTDAFPIAYWPWGPGVLNQMMGLHSICQDHIRNGSNKKWRYLYIQFAMICGISRSFQYHV